MHVSISAAGTWSLIFSGELTGDGGGTFRRETTVAKAPQPLMHRLYFTWAHEDSDFKLEMQGLSAPDLAALHPMPESFGAQARRVVGTFFRNFATGGKPPVHEQWLRYPSAPLDPAYYQQLLATASSMSEAEQRARAMIEPRATPREASDGNDGGPVVTVAITEAEQAWSSVAGMEEPLQHV